MEGIAQLSWHLFIDCKCGETLDLTDSEHDEEGRISIPIFNNKWDDLKGEEVICPKCSNPIIIERVEY